MKKVFLLMIAGVFAISASAQTTEKRGDNGGVLSIEASDNLACVPVTFSLNNPTAVVITGQAVFDAPTGAKFTENDDEEYVTPNEERAGNKKKDGSWAIMEKFDEATPSHIEISFLSQSNPTVGLKGTEGVVFTIYLDASALSDGEYEVKMTNVVVEDKTTDNKYVVAGTYNGVDATTPELAAPLVISGGKAQAGSAGVNKITVDEDAAQKSIYNIQGMKIRQTVPGRLYIVNGKKVIAQ